MKIYTQAELEGMSDLELNLFIQGINGPNITSPCNNWSDCGSLIDECGISIDYYNENTCDGNDPCAIKWMPYGYVGCTDKNPRRAVVIIYILIKQGE